MQATMVCPSAAAQIAETISPRPVAARMIGRALAPAAAGTYPTSARPSATEPTTKIGRPRMAGSPVAAGAGSETGGALVEGRCSATVDMGITLLTLNAAGRDRAMPWVPRWALSHDSVAGDGNAIDRHLPRSRCFFPQCWSDPGGPR